ncbi:MAG: lipoate--protein ligase family protein [Candidatus Kapabacteria bacterium]|nr:lipoate--protein ligase family protein [Candidatus Kapabacteria bacterium]MDW8012225.1 lipoate--protein ligase family protein [Bacteroidota bacterium]
MALQKLLATPELLALFGEPVECRSDGACPPRDNMQQDWERLLACASSCDTPPLLRFYAWQPWAISLGLHQPDQIADKERCRERGIEIVRRPTGGRAILHAEEVTYAVVVRLSSQRTPQYIYRIVHERIATALQQLTGKPIQLAPASADFRRLWSRPSGVACFNSSARWELSYAGRKLVGSAQRIVNGVLLQHGSILLGPAHLSIAELLRFNSEADREAFRQALAAHSISLQQLCGHHLPYDSVVAVLWESFCGAPYEEP